MRHPVSLVSLKVQKVEQVCLFELLWGKGQQLSATVPYPDTLTSLYQEWQRIYLSFYKTALRGRVESTGSVVGPPVDWHAKLVQAEAALLYEFHRWLRQEELYEIRSTIAQIAKTSEKGDRGNRGGNASGSPVDVFLACNPLELTRLPWESWEVETEFKAGGKVRIVRSPSKIRGTVTTANRFKRRGKARILAILGDETGLDFQTDREALRSLSRLAEIVFVGWQPGLDPATLKGQIVNAIQDDRGWDILFFAGHSNETALTGGELGIAPQVSISLQEITQPLTIAKERGLQFAIFNSCNGLSIANALIDLGLSQVAVMREPVHNLVAQEFLVRFFQSLAEYEDVHSALLSASQFLKLEKQFTYPSAYLIPSLFRHPEALPFRLPESGLKSYLKQWSPTPKEAIAIAALVIVSWQLPLQKFLLEKRVLAQSIYRQFTQQVPVAETSPLLIIQIDDQSIIDAKIQDPVPMDRKYLAKLVNKVSEMQPKVVVIDYLLDRPHGDNDRIFSQALKNAVQRNQTWFIFGADRNDSGHWVGVVPEVAGLEWTLQGDMNLFDGQGRLGYMRTIPRKDASSRNLPFAYLAALAYQLNLNRSYNVPQPQTDGSGTDFLSRLMSYLGNQYPIESEGPLGEKSKITKRPLFNDSWPIPYPQTPRFRLHPITIFSYRLHQMWMHPLIDFSIPPEQIYQRIPAWKFLQTPANPPDNSHPTEQVIMIASGGYSDSSESSIGSLENFPVPDAVQHWRSQQTPPDTRRFITGGEAHAYMFHHFLTQRIVIPIPDLWLVMMAILVGKGTVLFLEQEAQQRRIRLMSLLLIGTGVYGLIVLQLYISAAILLPFILPSIMFWTYVIPIYYRKQNHEEAQ